MKILVVGHKGLLGSEVFNIYKELYDIDGKDVDELDITSIQQCQKVVNNIQPDIIVNCAAYTAVDAAESDAENAFLVNETGAKNLAAIAAENDNLLIHFSTDYVFDGKSNRPYHENDQTNPLSVYGKSKRAGELRIQEQGNNHIIIRTSWLYGKNGPCFPKTIARLAKEKSRLSVVSDQRGCPTYASDLARHLGHFFSSSFRGIIHMTNSGEASWFDFAKYIVKELDFKDVDVQPVTTDSFPRPALRPGYSVLDTRLFQGVTGLQMRSWQESLKFFLNNDFRE